MVEATSDMVWELDLEGKYTYVSPKAVDLMGRKPEELIGRMPFEYMPAESAKKSIELFETLSKKPEMISAFESVSSVRTVGVFMLKRVGCQSWTLMEN